MLAGGRVIARSAHGITETLDREPTWKASCKATTRVTASILETDGTTETEGTTETMGEVSLDASWAGRNGEKNTARLPSRGIFSSNLSYRC